MRNEKKLLRLATVAERRTSTVFNDVEFWAKLAENRQYDWLSK